MIQLGSQYIVALVCMNTYSGLAAFNLVASSGFRRICMLKWTRYFKVFHLTDPNLFSFNLFDVYCMVYIYIVLYFKLRSFAFDIKTKVV